MPRALRRTVASSGSGPSVLSNPTGAPISATRDPALIPSFFGSGVPEYPASPRGRGFGLTARSRRSPAGGSPPPP